MEPAETKHFWCNLLDQMSFHQMPRCQLVIKIIVMIKIQFQNSDKESWKQTTNENIYGLDLLLVVLTPLCGIHIVKAFSGLL